MSSVMKYIVVDVTGEGVFPIVFPASLTHKEVARIHRAGQINVVAAGFCTLTSVEKGPAKAYGHSETLNLSSREKDTALLQASGF